MTKSKVDVQLQNEVAVLDVPAKVRVLVDGAVVKTIVAKVGRQKGADGAMYPAVELSEE